MDNTFELDNIHFRYPRSNTEALRGVSLDIPAGCCFGLLGPNGAGKTTLMRILSSDLEPGSGEIRFEGSAFAPIRPEVRLAIGIAPQEIALYSEMSATENLQFWGGMYNIPKAELTDRTRELLNAVGLSERANDRVENYSGGMKRRLNFACALIHRPRVLMLDEPTAGVDPQSRSLLFDLIESVLKQGVTVLYSTHYMEEAERLCNKIAVIDHGGVLACGAHEDLIKTRKLPTKLILQFASPAITAQIYDSKRLAEFGTQSIIDQSIVVLLNRPIPETIAHISDLPYSAIEIERPSLETLFLDLTGRTLRE